MAERTLSLEEAFADEGGTAPVIDVADAFGEGAESDSGDSQFVRGLKAGAFSDIPAAGGSALEILGHRINSKVVERKGREIREENMAQGREPQYQARVPEIEGIPGDGVLDTLGNAGDWAAYMIGRNVPNIALTALGGLGGAALVRGAGGALAGALPPGFILNQGEINRNLAEKDVPIETRADVAPIAGAAMAVADVALPVKIVNRLVGNTVGDGVKRGVAKRVLQGGASGFATEAVTEGPIQEGIAIAAEYAAGAGLPSTAEAISRIANAMAGGGVVGVGVGGAAGLVPDRTAAPQPGAEDAAGATDRITPAMTPEIPSDAPAAAPAAAAGDLTGIQSDTETPSEAVGTGERADPVVVEAPEHIRVAEQQVNVDGRTDNQIRAGNDKKAHLKFKGLNITVENPKGSVRSNKDPAGPAWSVVMPATYGYIKGTTGADGDKLDVYIGDKTDSDRVFVVDQVDAETQAWDEHKAILGVDNAHDAALLYDAGFSDGRGPARRSDMREMSVDQFKDWLANGDTTAEVAKADIAEPASNGQGITPPEDGAGYAPAAAQSVVNPAQEIVTAPDVPRETTDAVAEEPITETVIKPKGKAPARPSMSLAEFIAGKGGVRDTTGEIRAADGHLWHTEKPYRPKLLRDDGLDQDVARALAAEAGYIPDGEGVPEFLSALTDDMHTPGAVRTLEGDEAARARADADRAVDEAAQRADAEAEVRSEAKRIGLDLTPEEVSHIAEDIAAYGGAVDEVIVDFVEAKAIRDADNINDLPGDSGAMIEIPFEDLANAQAKTEPAETGGEPAPGTQGQKEDTAEPAAGSPAEREEPGSAGEGGAVGAPTTEATDQGEQTVLPGTEKISDKELAERRMRGRKKADTSQKGVDGLGLFDPDARDGKQGDVEDVAGKTETGLVPAIPTWAEFMAALPKDADGHPDIQGRAVEIFEQVAGKDGKSWKSLTDDQRLEAMQVVTDGAYEPLMVESDNDGRRAPADSKKSIGKNRRGNPVFEDERGVRSYSEGGIRVSESVGIIPGRGISVDKANRSSDFKTTEEDAPSADPASKPAKSTYGAGNKLVTNDAAEAARAVLRRKLNGSTLNAGMDPEVMMAGTTLAVYHLEAGSRAFGDFARAMVDDMGDVVRPFLRSWYEGARYYPGLDTTGMTPGAEIDRMGDVLATDEAENGIQDTVHSGDERPGAEDVHAASQDGQAGSARGRKVPGSDGTVRGDPEDSAESGKHDGPAGGRGTRSGDADRVPGRKRSTPQAPDDGVKGENFRIDAEALQEGRGWKRKALDNIRAIELTREIEAEGRFATRQEQQELALYVGWGGISGAFPDTDGSFAKGFEDVGKRLQDLLTDTEYATARRSIQYAHYTGETVVRAMWDAARRLGFKGGKVFEPGMGVGNFIGMMPDGIVADYNGLELDHMTARIARLLYPQSGVRQDDFTRAPLPKNTYDLVIGNPPFSDTVIRSDPEYAKHGFMLHDFFFAKSLDAVRPGGLMMFISSAGTMNKIDQSAREYLADRADLVQAIRLPGDAFEKNAGTSVTTDIIILRKKDENAPLDASVGAVPREQWVETTEVTLPDKDGNMKTGRVSRFFAENPSLVLGEEGFFDKLYAGRYGVRSFKDGRGLNVRLSEVVGDLPSNVMSQWQEPTERAEIDFGTSEHKEGSFYVGRNGDLMQVSEGVGVKVQKRGKGVTGGKTAAEMERIRGLIPVRDALREVYAADLAEDAGNADRARQRLNKAYDAFVEQFGPINKADVSYRRPSIVQQEGARSAAREEARYIGEPFDEGTFDPSRMIEDKAGLPEIARARQDAREAAEKSGKPFSEGDFDPADMQDNTIVKRPNIDPFMDDQEGYRLRAIEKHNDATGEHAKTTVFRESVIKRQSEPQIKSIGDAVLNVINEQGRFDLPAVAHLMGISESEAIEQLGESIFRLPGNGERWVTSDEYLSGNVRRKLMSARAAAEKDPSFRRNVSALEAVQPIPLSANEIAANLGMPWIPTEIVEEFGKDALGLESLSVSYHPVAATWFVSGDSKSANARSTWGTEEREAPLLIGDAANRKAPRIYREFYDSAGKKGSELDAVATQAAQEKVAEIKQKFRDWIYTDKDRTERLVDLYNETYNSTVVREYNGDYLTTPGITGEWSWRPHQTRVIARIIQSGNTYMAHAVGAGKTSAMIGAVMEKRRLGLSRKPMIAVPNHMLGQFTKEFYEQYPTARIMVADERRFHTGRRKQFIADVANSDLDAVIITHSAFGIIPISSKFQDGLIVDMIEEFRGVLRDIPDDFENRLTRKRIENRIEAMEQRLSGRSQGRKDQVFTFEEMGIDSLYVDEAHEFRKLDFATTMSNIKGVQSEGSKMSWDLYVKTRYLETVNPGHNLVLASGTPITNTMAELFTVSRYIQPAALKERQLEQFDAWAAAFGDTVTNLEQDASGGYKPVTRFAKFINVPELSVMVREAMDVVTSNQLAQYVTRPKLLNGKRTMVIAPPSQALKDYQESLASRMRAIESRKGPPQKGDDIMFKVIGDGRNAAVDMRLVDPDLPSDPNSKLNLMIDKVYETWKATKRKKFHAPGPDGYSEKQIDTGPATQMIFSNIGVSGARGFSVHQFIVSDLVRRGVPRNEIALIADSKTHVARQRLFNDLNEGKVRIVIGHTKRMATGVNAQRRLYAIHNLDPLWYPSEDEQRNGRGLRQGNLNPEIEISDYSTKGTYDSTMWGMMETKARFIQGFFEGDPNMRDMDDLGEASQYEQAKALSTADERLIVLTDLKQQLEKAVRRKNAHEREQHHIAYTVREARRNIEYWDKRLGHIRADIEQRTDTTGDNFTAAYQGKTFTDRVEFGDLILGEVQNLLDAKEEVKGRKIGEIGGFPLEIDIWKQGKDEFGASLELARSGDYGSTVNVGESSLGIVRSMESILRGFEENAQHAQYQIDKGRRDEKEFAPLIGKKFEGQAEIDRLDGEVQALLDELENDTRQGEDALLDRPLDELDGLEIDRFEDEGGAQAARRGGGERYSLGAADTQADPLLLAVEINKIFDAMAPKGTRLEATGPLFAEGDGLLASGAASGGRQRIAGMYQPLRDLIKVSLTTDDPKTTIRHETLHALKAHGLFTEQEWALLEAESRARWMDHWGVPDVEEGIAYEFGAYRRGDKPSGRLLPAVRRAFKRLNDFLIRIANMLGGMGFQTYEDVFARIESGEVRGREGRGASGREERFAFKRKGDAESAAEEMTAATGFVHLVQPADPYANRPKSWVVSNRFVPVEVSGAVLTPRQQRFRDNMDRQRRGETVDWEAEDRDFQQAAEVGERYAAAWHGSPHDHDQFTTGAIGTGEGAQAYGWGLYFASKREIAEHYRNILTVRDQAIEVTVNGDRQSFPAIDPKKITDAVGLEVPSSYVFQHAINSLKSGLSVNESIDAARADYPHYDPKDLEAGIAAFRDADPKLNTKGRLYKVELAPAEDQYLLWDKPLSEQSEKVRDALHDAEIAHKAAHAGQTGEQIYRSMTRADYGPIQTPRDASLALKDAGIRGIKYLDGSSRNRPFKDVKRAFIDALPEDADFSEVMAEIGTGTFTAEQEAVLKALEADGWLGFDYPSQAISAAYGNLSNWDPSPALVKAVADSAKDGTFNYVIFDEADISIEAKYAIARDTSAESPAGLWQRGVMETAETTGVSIDAIRKAGGPLWSEPEKARGTADQEAAIARILADRTAAPVGERIRDAILGIKENAARRLRQGIADQFDSIAHYEKTNNDGALRDAATSAYKAARMTQNLQSVMHVLLKRGMIAYKGGQFVRVDGFDGGFEQIFSGLADRGLMRLWAGWAVANRAKRLSAEGRENLLSDADIDTLLTLEKQYPEFRQVLKRWDAYNRAILDMAEAAGVIDPESRKVWENNDYVPFYRVIEDDMATGPRGNRGIANQRSGIRQLKGGTAQINDLIENMVKNVSHLVDASFKNVAAVRTISEAQDSGAVSPVRMDWKVAHVDPSRAARLLEDIGVQVQDMTEQQKAETLKLFTMRPPKDPDTVSVLVGGKPKYFRVDDPLLLSAMTHMNRRKFDWFTEVILGKPKQFLTRAVTSFPDFMIANAIRDSASAWVVSGGKTSPIAAAKGFVESLQDSTSRQAIAAAGGGTSGYYDVTPEDVRRQLDPKFRGGTRNMLRAAWEAWNAVGMAAENGNRIAVFKKLKSEGATDAEAAFQAMDLMDFSMRGDWTAIRWLATVVPFLNARLQGLYKLGRAASENPAGFAARGLAITAATLAIAAANWDDERYEDLPEWEKDTYYHVWVGDAHFRIPKPFEVGAIFSTLPERLIRFMAGTEDAGQFGEAMGRMFLDTFAFNPIPQAVRPIAEQVSNKNFFTGAPIESFYQQDLLPGQRVRVGTSALAKLLGEAFPGTVSPLRADALMQGYFGTLGASIMEASNITANVVSDVPAPSRRIDELPVIKRFVRADPPKYTRFLNDFYDLRNEATQIVRSSKALASQGDAEAAYKLMAENPDARAIYKMTNKASKKLSTWSKMQQSIRADKTLSPDEKRRRLDEIYAARNALAKRVVTLTENREKQTGHIDRIVKSLRDGDTGDIAAIVAEAREDGIVITRAQISRAIKAARMPRLQRLFDQVPAPMRRELIEMYGTAAQ